MEMNRRPETGSQRSNVRVRNNDDDSTDHYQRPSERRHEGGHRVSKQKTPIGDYRYFPRRQLVISSDWIMTLITFAMITAPSGYFLFRM
jgi:hypothetical protein